MFFKNKVHLAFIRVFDDNFLFWILVAHLLLVYFLKYIHAISNHPVIN